jgi:hypothetical protein
MYVTRSIAAITAASLLLAPMTAMAQYVQVQVQPQYQPQQPVYQQAPPPPPNAQAGDGQYVAPMQQQTLQTYVPQSVAMSGPRVIRDWQEGDPIPPGYHPVSRVRGGMIGGGAGMFGGPYLLSVLIAAIGTDVCNAEGTGCTNTLAPLYIPVVGPFITLGTAGGSATGDVFLVIDGILQATGVAMMIYGIAVPKVVLLRNDLGVFKNVMPGPIVGKNFSGVGLTGQF